MRTCTGPIEAKAATPYRGGMTLAKICGVTTPEAMRAAVQGRAAFVGVVAYPRSPRRVSPLRAAALLEQTGLALPEGRAIKVVAVTVDADDGLLAGIRDWIMPDYVQLHGSETPERADQVRALTGAGIIRALPVSTAADIDAALAWEDHVDHLMFDARPPEGSLLPGGVGASFDWSLLSGRRFARPWFLAGGLNPANVAGAVALSGAPMVDVSSGVESAPGVKDNGLIAAFLSAAAD
jgi:phosphoribosylanthranilate isomerase